MTDARTLALLPGGTLWFRISSGENAGRIRLRGWMGTAVGEPYRPAGLVSVAICPRCNATVFADPAHAYGDQTWGHEQWHAETDYPIPAELTGGPQ